MFDRGLLTDEEIITTAQRCGGTLFDRLALVYQTDEVLKFAQSIEATVAQKAVEAEREACALACDSIYYQHIGPTNGEVRYGIAKCAASIRARGIGGGELSNDLCNWYSGKYGGWHSACGTAYIFESGGPIENGHKFCHCCGKPLIVSAAKESQ